MAHKLKRLATKLHNTPHLMTQELLEQADQYFSLRNSDDYKPDMAITARKREDYELNISGSLGWMNIHGPLTYLEYEPMCGEKPVSYQQLHSEMEAMVEAGVKTVVIDADSGGGEAYGMMEEARFLRDMADANDIKLIAYVDGIAASACYGLVSVADEIIINPDAEVGSIGVVVSLLDTSEYMNKQGLKRVFITAGKSKVPFDNDGKFKESFINDIQEKVDMLYDKFAAHVSTYRKLSVEAVKDTEAKMFMADDALKLGLVDKVMSRQEFLKYLADDIEARKDNMGIMDRLFKAKQEAEVEQTLSYEEIQQKLTEVTESAATLEADLNEAVLLIQEKDTQLESKSSELAVALEKLAAYEAKEAEVAAAEKAAAEAEAKAKADARLASMTELLGDEKGAEQYAKFAEVDDETFNMIVDGLKAKAALEANGSEFKELGLGGTKEQIQEDPTTRKLKEKYAPKKLENK